MLLQIVLQPMLYQARSLMFFASSSFAIGSPPLPFAALSAALSSLNRNGRVKAALRGETPLRNDTPTVAIWMVPF